MSAVLHALTAMKQMSFLQASDSVDSADNNGEPPLHNLVFGKSLKLKKLVTFMHQMQSSKNMIMLNLRGGRFISWKTMTLVHWNLEVLLV